MKFVLCISLIFYFCNSICAQQSWVDSATSNPNTGSIGKQGIKGPDESNEPKPNNPPSKPWRRRPGRRNRPIRPQYPGIGNQVGDAIQERLIFNKKKDKGKEKEEEKPKKKGSYKRKGCRSAHIDPDDVHHEHHGDHEMEESVVTSLPNESMPRASPIIPAI